MSGNTAEPLPSRPRDRTARGTATLPRVAAGVLAVVALALAGCSGGESDDPPVPQETAAGALLIGQWPLTGLEADGAAPRHPVMVVKVDNTVSSEPQLGLDQADLVAEELVEGGLTRLAVFYYSAVPETVGPVRSLRASDIGIVKPADAVLVASGGSPGTSRRIRAAGIDTVTEGGPGFHRDAARRAPYNLLVDLPKLARTLKGTPPEDYFAWGSEKDFPEGRKATALTARFSAGTATSWEFRGGRYVNLTAHTEPGDQFEPQTVLVLRVEVGDAGYLDPAGARVPETKFVGDGQAMVFHDGRLVRATWSKPRPGSAVRLETEAGELALPPGRVWMELVPADGGDVSIGR